MPLLEYRCGEGGFPEVRAEISKNCAYCYPCLHDLIFGKKWHAGYGPFFHYFALLWQFKCKAHRGKHNIISALNGYATPEGYGQAVSSSSSEDVGPSDEPGLEL